MSLTSIVRISKRPFVKRRDDGLLDISGLSKAVVLQTLYNCSRVDPETVGVLTDKPLSLAEAESCIREAGSDLVFLVAFTRFVMADLSGDLLDPSSYDEANGPNAGRRAIELIRPAQVVWK